MRRATAFPVALARGLCAVCILSTAAVRGLAASNDPANVSALAERPLALADARRLSFQRNWDLLAVKSEVDLALAQRLVTREFPNPILSLGVTKINADKHPAHTAQGNGLWDRSYDTVSALSQLIEIGGKRTARKASATAG